MSQNVFGGTSLVLTTLQSLNSIMNTIASGIATLNNNIVSISQIMSNQLQALIRLSADMRTTKGKSIVATTSKIDPALLQSINIIAAASANLTTSSATITPNKTPTNLESIKTLFSGGSSFYKGAAKGAMYGTLAAAPLGSGVGIGTLGGGLIGGLGGIFKGIGQSMKPMVSQFAAMGPQMLAMSLIMQPIQAFLEGILTPLEPLTELFGAFGEILGTALIPLVNMLMAFLMPMIPVLQGIANLLAPILPLLFMMLTPFGQLMAIFQIIGAFMPPDVAAWFNNLPTIIGEALTNAGSWLSTQLGNLWNIVVDFFGNLGFQLGVVLTRMINDTFKVSLGGADANMFTSV